MDDDQMWSPRSAVPQEWLDWVDRIRAEYGDVVLRSPKHAAIWEELRGRRETNHTGHDPGDEDITR